MDARGELLRVSPQELQAAAAALRPAWAREDQGVHRSMGTLADAVGSQEATDAGLSFSHRLRSHLDLIDGQRSTLRRTLDSAAFAYADTEWHSAGVMRRRR